MPLTMAQVGQHNVIRRVAARDDMRRHLASLGFVEGETVTVVSDVGGNLILTVKGARVALGREMACRIII